MEYHLYEDNGYIVTDPISPLAVPSIKNCYDSRRWSLKVYDVTTDTPSNTYARSPGKKTINTQKSSFRVPNYYVKLTA